MIEKVRELVYEIFKNDSSGHGIEHMDRVLFLALKFSEEEGANKLVVALAALLHDVDDYKMVGIENAPKLTNTRRILNEAGVDLETQKQVLEIVKTIGYSIVLKGIRPNTIEGMVVSDADMCDAMGASGIIRSHSYNIKKGTPFFNKNIWPTENMTAEQYIEKPTTTSVCNAFEKLLRLKDYMMTNSGKKEALKRHQVIVDFLYELFEEENAHEWTEYLNNWLEEDKRKTK